MRGNCDEIENLNFQIWEKLKIRKMTEQNSKRNL